MGFCLNLGILGFWESGIREFGRSGIWEFWGAGLWGILGLGNLGIWEFGEFWEVANGGKMGSWKFGDWGLGGQGKLGGRGFRGPADLRVGRLGIFRNSAFGVLRGWAIRGFLGFGRVGDLGLR